MRSDWNLVPAWLAARSASVLLVALGSGASAVSAQSVRLNAPLAGPSADVAEFAVDPTRTIALYVADQDQLGVQELYAVPIDQSAPPRKLNAPLPAFGDVAGFRIGPAGRIVYRADSAADGAFGLFGTTLGGAQPPIALTPSIGAGRQVSLFSLSDDGAWLAYVADQDADEVYELYAMPSDGSTPAHRVHALLGNQDVFTFRIDPTASHVLYAVDESNPIGFSLVSRLFSAPLDESSPPLELASHSLSYFSGGVDQIEFSPDGSWSAYNVSVEQSFEFYRGLCLVPVDGSLATRGVSVGQITSPGRFTPDGSRVVFSGTFTYAGSAPNQNLFSATLTDPPTALDQAEPGGGSWQLSADGTTVFFGQPSGVYRVPVDGSAPPQLLAALSEASYGAFELSPDGATIAVVLADIVPGTSELRSLPSAGGPTVTLAQVPAAQELTDLRFSPDSLHLVFDQHTSASVHELFLVPVTGGHGPLRVNDPLPPQGTVRRGFSLVDPGWTLYLASQRAGGVFELFKAPFERRRTLGAPPGPPPPP